MIDSNVPVFLILSLTLLKIYFSGGNPGKASCCKGFVLSLPVKFWGSVCRGESVREGKTEEAPRQLCRGASKKGRTSPMYL
ncbi:hypothetical protein CLOLEP_00833 [[Clostridium] leptum DSM 753]|uniref:Uncharacterized protein n=1 Tax=[Clostridium] leptum DSM 753 TaxID=428125 RepID=A7VQK3_9FIRM|nr:hypothetical protein CLOLEP_00833 [[Clostridium] leptum DSM 753]